MSLESQNSEPYGFSRNYKTGYLKTLTLPLLFESDFEMGLALQREFL